MNDLAVSNLVTTKDSFYPNDNSKQYAVNDLQLSQLYIGFNISFYVNGADFAVNVTRNLSAAIKDNTLIHRGQNNLWT